jgi:hypothetical protein
VECHSEAQKRDRETTIALPKAVEARSGVVEAYSGVVKDDSGALERYHGSFVARPEAVEAHTGFMKAYPGALEALEPWKLFFSHRYSSWSHTVSPWSPGGCYRASETLP